MTTTAITTTSDLLDQLNQHLAAIIKERDELRGLLRQAREFIIVQTWRPNESRTESTGTRGRQALGLITRIDAALNGEKSEGG